MAIIVGDKLYNPNRNAVNLDANYGPYDSLTEATEALTANRKMNVGVTVGVRQEDGSIKEYWVQPVNEENVLVEKGSGTGDTYTKTEIDDALAAKASATDVATLEDTVAAKLTRLTENIRGVYKNRTLAEALCTELETAFAGGDEGVAGSIILIIDGGTADSVTLLTFNGNTGTWDETTAPLNLSSSVKEVSVRAITGEEVGDQIAAITVDGVTYNLYAPLPGENSVAIDITLDSQNPSDTRIPSSRCVKLALDEKADLTALESLQQTVAGKADQTDLDTANQDISDLQQAVAEKAAAADLATLQNTVTEQGQAIEANADAIATKADASDLTALEGTVEGHGTTIDQHTEQIAAKANASDVYTKAETDTALGQKVNVAQGSDNAGKVMTVNAEGNVVPAEPSADGNTLNLGKPDEGYYTLATAVAAVPNKKRKTGLCITYMTGAEQWETMQFVGSDTSEWSDTTKWQEAAGSSVEVDTQLDAESGNPVANSAVAQRIFDLENSAVSQVDETLDSESTNPVQNKVVAGAIADLQNPTFNADVEEVDEGQQVTLSTQTGHQVAQFTVTGGGGGSTETSKIVLSALVSADKVKEGGHSVLSWYYNHVNADGAGDGVEGAITVTVKRGAVTLHEETLTGVSPSEAAHQITLDSWLTTAGTIGVTIKAECNLSDGTTQTKQFYVSVSVVSLSLTLNNATTLINKALAGGFADGETITVGYTVKGSGSKEINLYIDGSTTPMSATITRSGTTNGQFTIAASSLTAGRHVLQMVATNGELLSESTYIDILKAEATAPFIGLYFVRDDGGILYTDYLTPVVTATQYVSSTFYYFVYDPSSTSATLTEYRDGTLNQTFAVGRTRQAYTSRYLTAGNIAEQFVCGATTYNFEIDVEASSIDISKATANLSTELTAIGRSNDEANPAQWTSGNVTTRFYNFDWKSSGWNGDALVMKNGARIVVNVLPFDGGTADPAATGKTIEMEFKVSNVIDGDADIISCLSEGKGFHVTGSKASMLTGSSVTYTDEDGNEQTRVGGVEKTFATDIDIKMAFVIGPRSTYRLMELYINGSREKADIYNTTDNFVQTTPVGITFDSAAADIELRSIRIYDRALDDDELVDNFIVDRKTVTEMISKYEENDVLENGLYDITKILSKGKGVVHFVRAKGLDEVNSANNKKTDFLTDVIYYSPFGPEWDLKIVGCNMRIQGTSSTKYPRKNYRIYLLKPSTAVVYRRNASTGDWEQDTEFDGYAFRDGDREAPLICLKADYSDSSMTMNTGGAKMWDYVTRELGLLTPPQEVDPDVRQAIDGFPVDVFCTDTEDTTNAVKYYGQYNFNHDKGKSKNIFGHVNLTDDEDVVHNFKDSIALEGLNNSSPMCLFQAAGSDGSTALSDQLTSEFDDGFEFNHPEDTVWDVSDTEHAATTTQRNAVSRLLGWIHDCVAATDGVDISDPDYGDANGWSGKSKWVCQKFKDEVANYFNVQHLCTYKIFTEYFMSVDQQTKNTILRTWDYLHWYITYYDGDTQLGKRNDSFLVYLYTLSRDTWDSDKSKYAYEGHNSWLWCLVLANLEDELKTAAKNMRNILTNDYVLNMLNVEQQGNWCERAYNKSGEFKYIIPATEGVTVIRDGVETEGVIYPFIYALDGTNYSHRVYTILHRFALLDAKYGCDTFKGDNVEMYLSRLSTDPTGTINITSNAPYYFDWNTKNGSHSDPQQADEGETVTLSFTGAITVNDPVDLYGASCMEKLDLTGVGGSLQNGINLGKATLLREIDASSDTRLTQSWFFNFEACTRLRKIDCTNQFGVKTGTASSTEFNVTNQTRLEELYLGGTGILSVEIAEGAPLTHLTLPSTLTVLKLRYLSSLTDSGLTIEGYNNITTLNFAACPNLDWTAIAAACPNLNRLRVEGVNMEDDGTILLRYKDLRGVDADGNAVATCQLVGDVYLTQFLDDELLATLRSAYPSLNIHLPEYTGFEFDDTVSDPANIKNLENNTGYDEGGATEFVSSGHVKIIHDNFIPVYGQLNDAGNFEAHRISEENYKQLPDGEAFDYDDPTGVGYDTFKLFPHCWIKGVNDYKNEKKYVFWSSNDNCPSSSATSIVRKALSEILYTNEGGTITDGTNYALNVNNITAVDGTVTLETSGVLASATNVNTYLMDVTGMKQVRYPGLNNAYYGACFLNADGGIISKYHMASSSTDFTNGDYIFLNVPDGAVSFVFSTLATLDSSTEAIAVNSTKIEAIEPDWVEVNPFLVGIYQASVDSLIRIRSLSGVTVRVGTGTQTTSSEWNYDNEGYPTNTPLGTLNYTCKDLMNLAYRRGKGYQLVDYEMSKMVALLFYCHVGNRDASYLCGYGKSAGGSTGYKDSSGNDDGLLATPGSSGSGNKVLGLESWFACTYEWMDRVAVNVASYESALANRMVAVSGTDSVNAIWHIYDPTTKTERTVQGITSSGSNIGRVKNGRYCDVIASKLTGDTQYATYYCDASYYTASTCRVVGRSYCSANAHGGLAFASASYASSYSYAYYGSRLAFRPPSGKSIILVEDE